MNAIRTILAIVIAALFVAAMPVSADTVSTPSCTRGCGGWWRTGPAVEQTDVERAAARVRVAVRNFTAIFSDSPETAAPVAATTTRRRSAATSYSMNARIGAVYGTAYTNAAAHGGAIVVLL